MIVWLHLKEDEWARLSSKDPIRVTSGYHFKRDKNHDEIPYEWIRKEMSVRLGPPPASRIYPLDVYIQWEGKTRPDLRTIRYWYSGGERAVLVTASVNEKDVLQVDEELWFYVLNHWYIPENEADAEQHEKRYTPYPYWTYHRRRYKNSRFQKEVRQSWNKIFDLNIKNDYITSGKGEKSILGWIWELPQDSIVQTRYFKGAGKAGS